MTEIPLLLMKYWKWIAGAAIVALLVIAYNVHVDGLIKVAVTKAVTENNQSWEKAEQVAIAKARAEALAQEKAHQVELATIQKQREEDQANAKTRHDQDVAAARAGALRLRIPAPACPSGANLPGPAAGADPASPATIDLPGPVTASLYGLADDADSLVTDYKACLATLASDRHVFPTPKGVP